MSELMRTVEVVSDPARIEAAFEHDQEAEDSRPMPLLLAHRADEAIGQVCACFPGTCRGGEVINGRTANGQICRSAFVDLAETRRRADTKADRDKLDERLAVAILRAELDQARAERDRAQAAEIRAKNIAAEARAREIAAMQRVEAMLLVNQPASHADQAAAIDRMSVSLQSAAALAFSHDRADFLAKRLPEISDRFLGVEPLRSELREAGKILRAVADWLAAR